jgi:hypothetical protein
MQIVGLNNTLLKDQWVTGEMRKETRKFLEFNENANATYQNLWDTAKAGLRHFIAIHAYIKRTERYKINYLMINYISNSWKNKNKQNSNQTEGEKS